jgi:hypothetical protein
MSRSLGFFPVFSATRIIDRYRIPLSPQVVVGAEMRRPSVTHTASGRAEASPRLHRIVDRALPISTSPRIRAQDAGQFGLSGRQTVTVGQEDRGRRSTSS